MNMNRRIVTNDRVFRIQCSDPRSIDPTTPITWTFYPGYYSTREEAQAACDRWAALDAEEQIEWRVV